MRNQQQQSQNLIVQFDERWKHRRKDWKSMTAYHFMDQGFPKSTIYSFLDRFERTGSIERKRGSGRKAIRMILIKREVLRRAANHKTGVLNKSLLCDSAVASHIFVELLEDSKSCV